MPKAAVAPLLGGRKSTDYELGVTATPSHARTQLMEGTLGQARGELLTLQALGTGPSAPPSPTLPLPFPRSRADSSEKGKWWDEEVSSLSTLSPGGGQCQAPRLSSAAHSGLLQRGTGGPGCRVHSPALAVTPLRPEMQLPSPQPQ